MKLSEPSQLREYFESLVTFFRKEIEEYGMLLNLVCEQQNCLMQHNPISLLQATTKIEAQLPYNQKATKEREMAMQKLEQTLQCPPLTFEILPSFAPENLRYLFNALTNEIITLVKKIKSKTQLQQRLLNQAQTINDSILKHLQPTSTSTYDSQGKMVSPSSFKELS